MDFYIWRDNIVGSLLGLSDTKYQRLAWTGAVATADGSPDEMIVTLLDDWAFASFANDNSDQLNEVQVARVSELLRALERYTAAESDFDGNVDRVLASSAWCEIVEAAKALYLALCPSENASSGAGTR